MYREKLMVLLILILITMSFPAIEASETRITFSSKEILRVWTSSYEYFDVTLVDIEVSGNRALIDVKTDWGTSSYYLPKGEKVEINGVYFTLVDYFVGTEYISITIDMSNYYSYYIIKKPPKLMITSNPSKADVYIDGEYKGTTPLTVEVSAGTHKVKVVKKGYYAESKTVSLKDGEEKTLTFYLTPKVAKINVYSKVGGTKVYLNGRYKGIAPLTLKFTITQVGKYEIKGVKEGYYDAVKTIEITEDDVDNEKTFEVWVTPSPKPATLTIRSVPSGATVFVNGNEKGKTPLTLELSPGQYEIRLSLKGYYDEVRKVTLNPGEEKTLPTIHLREKPTSIYITSTPPRAEVYINGERKGVTPLMVYLQPGTYTVKLSLLGFPSQEKTIKLERGDYLELSFKFPGKLIVYSEPKGAEVKVDGHKGKTPFEVFLSEGNYEVLVSYPKFVEYKRKVSITPGDVVEIRATLVPKNGTLKIYSDPDGAEIYVNNVKRGMAPLTLSLPPGSYTIVARMRGYGEEKETVIIEPEDYKTVKLSLSPLPVTLEITSAPPGASVYVDGEYKGTTPLTLEIDVGEHQIELKKSMYFSYSTMITLYPGEDKELNITLKWTIPYILAGVIAIVGVFVGYSTKKKLDLKNIYNNAKNLISSVKQGHLPEECSSLLESISSLEKQLEEAYASKDIRALSRINDTIKGNVNMITKLKNEYYSTKEEVISQIKELLKE